MKNRDKIATNTLKNSKEFFTREYDRKVNAEQCGKIVRNYSYN